MTEKTENWLQYQSHDINDKKKGLTYKHFDNSIRSNNFIGIDVAADDFDDVAWSNRPDEAKYGIAGVALKHNYDWKGMVEVKNFLSNAECDWMINKFEEQYELYPKDEHPDFYEWDENYSKRKSRRKIFNKYLDKYEFLDERDGGGPTISGHNNSVMNWRSSTTHFIQPFQYGWDWYWEKVTKKIEQINDEIYKINLTQPITQEPMQLTKYNAPNGNYAWHTDWKGGSYADLRKLSYTIQLSDPRDYEGGYFQIDTSGGSFEEGIATKKRGTLILFPSFTNHRLSQVTKGTRYSAVGWVVGDHWK